MHRETMARWERLAHNLIFAARGCNDTATAAVDAEMRHASTRAGILAKAIDAAGGRWDATVDMDVMARWRQPGLDDATVVANPYGKETLSLKCLKLAYALVMERFDDIPRSDRETLSSLMGAHNRRKLPEAGWIDPPPWASDDPAGPVEVAFAWRQAGSNGRGRSTLTKGSLNTFLFPIDGDQAPVACRLRTVEDGWIEVRRRGDGFLRPLLAPGTWLPIGVARFKDAVASGEPWADNPFQSSGSKGPLLGVDDVAFPAAPRRAGDGGRLDVAAAAILDAAPMLFAIDGIVFRETEPPVLCIETYPIGVCTRGSIEAGRHESFAMTWRLGGDLSMVAGQDGFRSMSQNQWRFGRVAGAHGHLDWSEVPAGDHLAAKLALDAYVGLVDAQVDARATDRPPVRTPPIKDVDRLLLPASERPLHAANDRIRTHRERQFPTLSGQDIAIAVGDLDASGPSSTTVALTLASDRMGDVRGTLMEIAFLHAAGILARDEPAKDLDDDTEALAGFSP